MWAFGSLTNFCNTASLICLFTNYSDYFPSTITYEAFTEDVNEWPKKLTGGNIPILREEEMTVTEEK